MACDPDGGANPCGSADLGVDRAEVQANPNSVLSAKVLVAAHGAASLRVLFQPDGGGVESTPAFAATGAYPDGGDQVLPVLGLSAATDYALQVEARDDDGGLAYSGVLPFTTGALPANIPAFNVATDGGATPGYILLSRLQAATVAAPQPVVIIDREGKVVWYREESPTPNGDFQKQADGTYTISVRQPPTLPSAFPSLYERVDALGDLVATYRTPDLDGGTDNHELRLLPDGDVLLIGSTARTMDMTAYDGGAAATVVGNTLWRLQPDGTVAFHWDSFDYVPIGDTSPLINLKTAAIDATHFNAFDTTSDGNYLVSSRHTSQVMKLDAQTGAVLWRLGRHGDFTFVNDPLGGFSFQHFAREIAPNRILLFDNGNEHAPTQSRAVEYVLDPVAMTATLVWQYAPSPTVYGSAMGSVQRLPNGNTLISFGAASRADEVDPAGNLLWSITDPHPAVGFYRALWIDTLY